MRVFLDANWYIDVVRRDKDKVRQLSGHQVFFSPLSTHILFYVYNLKIQNKEIEKIHRFITPIACTDVILNRSLKGPTSDLEDNIQLNSAVEADCQVFLTQDRKLLKLGYYGKVEIKDIL